MTPSLADDTINVCSLSVLQSNKSVIASLWLIAGISGPDLGVSSEELLIDVRASTLVVGTIFSLITLIPSIKRDLRNENMFLLF